jgi:hypothetical protein
METSIEKKLMIVSFHTNFKIIKNNVSKIICDISIATLLPTCTGFATFRNKFKSGLKTFSQNKNIFRYCPVNRALYGVNLENTNKKMTKTLTII